MNTNYRHLIGWALARTLTEVEKKPFDPFELKWIACRNAAAPEKTLYNTVIIIIYLRAGCFEWSQIVLCDDEKR